MALFFVASYGDVTGKRVRGQLSDVRVRTWLAKPLAAGERIAVRNGTGLEPLAEPLSSLRGASVRERFGADVSGRHALQTVIANRRGRAQTRGNVGLVDNLALFGGVAPHAGKAVRL